MRWNKMAKFNCVLYGTSKNNYVDEVNKAVFSYQSSECLIDHSLKYCGCILEPKCHSVVMEMIARD